MWHCNTLALRWTALCQRILGTPPAAAPLQRGNLQALAQLPPALLPAFVRTCPVAMKYLRLLGTLDWAHFPERPGGRAWPGPRPAPRAPFVAAYLVKLEEGKPHLGQLRTFLVEHPALVWVLGFPLVPAPTAPWGFDVEAAVPSRKHLGRVLRDLDNAALQFLLTASVKLLAAALPADVPFGAEVALDTKHILAWVRENNPKVFVRDRYDKTRQPHGDPDCKLGCKQKENRRTHDAAADEEAAPHAAVRPAAPAVPTPTTAGQPASGPLPPAPKGEYYWGYASGVVATRLETPTGVVLGEAVLAELTQTFDHSDQSYFLPLMARTERNLGRAPQWGALDKAYDAWYVYAYFHAAGGFAAVPWADRADHRKTFSPDGLPLCAAGLPMPLKATFWQKSNCLVPHEDGRYGCPLSAANGPDVSCPVHHANWPKGGCITTLPTSIGNRVRHELDRQSEAFKDLYRQRTATERINSQALALGIERPHLRNGRAIANLNTLIYVLINLRTLARVQSRQAQLAAGVTTT